jgi:FixJ family two-component response regulator
VLSAALRGTSGLELQADLNMIGNRASVLFVSGPCDVSIAVQALRSQARWISWSSRLIRHCCGNA